MKVSRTLELNHKTASKETALFALEIFLVVRLRNQGPDGKGLLEAGGELTMRS
jgi:hypothetical protein